MEGSRAMEAVEMLVDFVNGASRAEKAAFVDRLLTEHRAIQQEVFDLMILAIRGWADLPEDRIDLRNNGAVLLSKMVVQALQQDMPLSL